MTAGFVDAASVYEVLLALSRSDPTLSYKTEWERALEVTAIFISAEHISVPQTPIPEGDGFGLWGIMLNGFEGRISRAILPNKQRPIALRKTKRWVAGHLKLFAVELDSLFPTIGAPVDEQGRKWLNAHVEREWPEISNTNG